MTVTKRKLAESMQARLHDVNPYEAQLLVDRVLEILKDTLAGEEDVLISGFGKFVVRQKQKRRGRNPQTGQSLLLRERLVVVFKPSSTLRGKLNR